MASILTSIKKLLGPEEADTSFDIDIIIGINSALMVLNQLGVGPKDGFVITDKTQTWEEFLGESKILEGVKTYVYLKTKLDFDPPSSAGAMDAMDRRIKEWEYRLVTMIETQPVPVVVPEPEV